MFKLPDRLPGRPLFQPEVPGDGHDGEHRNLQLRPWILSSVLLLAGLIISGDFLLDLLTDIAEVLFDFVEETLENFYRKSGKMDLRHAQMATAYTYLAFFTVAALITARRLANWVYSRVRQTASMLDTHKSRWQKTYRSYSIFFSTWWESLDGLNRLAVTVGLLMGAVPLFILLSLGLGMAVAELF